MPNPVSPVLWQSMLQDLMNNITTIEAAEDSSAKGLLFQYLEQFCTSRVQARTVDEILLGKPFTDEQWHYFRISDFCSYLERVRFREFKVHQITSMFNEAGGDHERKMIKGKTVNVWRMPLFDKQTEGFDMPEIKDTEVM